MKRTDSIDVEYPDEVKNQKVIKIKIESKQISSNQFILDPEEKNQEYVIDVGIRKKKKDKKVRNQKFPNSIKDSIRKNATGKKIQEGLTQSKIARAILERARKLMRMFVCQICICEYDEIEKQKIGNCEHVFCNSCIHQYVQYKISRFEEVVCPQEFCNQVIDTEGQLYKRFRKNLQMKHKKIRAFYLAEKNNLRICPNEKCVDGIINTKEGGSPKCDKCKRVYCPKCFFPEHSNPCEKNEVDFFEKNLKFRQCNSCKTVVEKAEGCNHITCKCKYEFCYLCGGAWNKGNHRCGDPQQFYQIQPIQQIPQIRPIQRTAVQRDEEERIQRQARIQYQQSCQYKFKFFIKIFFISPIYIIFLSILIPLMTIGFIATLIIIVPIGFLGYSVYFIYIEQHSILRCYEILFCPLFGLGTIVVAWIHLSQWYGPVICGTPVRWITTLKRIFYDW